MKPDPNLDHGVQGMTHNPTPKSIAIPQRKQSGMNMYVHLLTPELINSLLVMNTPPPAAHNLGPDVESTWGKMARIQVEAKLNLGISVEAVSRPGQPNGTLSHSWLMMLMDVNIPPVIWS